MSGPTGRPRRRLRRGVRAAGGWLLILAAMGGTFSMGWTIRGSRSPALTGSAASSAPYAMAPANNDALAGDFGASSRALASDTVPGSTITGRGDAAELPPTLGAPVADADGSVVFPGYVLPDDRLEDPAHEGS